jgi:nitroimidazol reductase NimA-like FMN-containing flavoprotein (pyridoxamine 5'-phosphate oxidase superfamily)
MVVLMDIVKIPSMNREEYDKLIIENHISRIAFAGDSYPYMAPFMYVFNEKEKFLYFISTKYGKKIELFNKNPNVAVEIEEYSNDMSNYKFITLQGKIIEVEDEFEKNEVMKNFVNMIQNKLSSKALAALGYSPNESPESLLKGDKTLLWKLIDVKKIVALKNP